MSARRLFHLGGCFLRVRTCFLATKTETEQRGKRERRRGGEKRRESGGAFRCGYEIAWRCRVNDVLVVFPPRDTHTACTGVQKALKTKNRAPSNSPACDSAWLHVSAYPRLAIRSRISALFARARARAPPPRSNSHLLYTRTTRVNECKDRTTKGFSIPRTRTRESGIEIFFEIGTSERFRLKSKRIAFSINLNWELTDIVEFSENFDDWDVSTVVNVLTSDTFWSFERHRVLELGRLSGVGHFNVIMNTFCH